MREVLCTPLAAEDTRDILDRLLEQSEAAAEQFTDGLAAVCRLLAGQPRMGRARDDLLAGMRSVLVGPYVVFYRPTDAAIQILRIIRGSRNITPDMFEAE